MNTQSNAMYEAGVNAQSTTPARLSPTRPFYWTVRRELWENRSIYLAPLGVAAAFLFGFAISTIHLPAKIRGLSGLDPAHQRQAISMPYDLIAGLMMATGMIVGVFYSIDALQGERRDRSILFWKSLPVSDVVTVLSKASIPIVVLPLLAFAVTVATQWLMLLLSSAVLAGSGLSVGTLWAQVSFFQSSLLLLYHLVTVHAIWHAPIYAWLLLVSAWARRAAFLWATLPVVAIAGFEKVVFHTSYFGMMLAHRLGGGAEAMTLPGTLPMNPMTHLTPGNYLTSAGLWIGLAFTAAFLAGAVRLRRSRGPM
ncbi:MAG TPA: ABC transporter permease [Candidatus Sulfotelmatobacter sp.]|nr:ABC transporter permease [Candidatus Sulfotelmatobacter sp.]